MLWLPSYGMHNDSVNKKKKKKKNQREVTRKQRKGDKSFWYGTHCLNLIHNAIKFYQDISYGYSYLWYPQGQSKGSNSETEKERAIFLYATHPLNLIYIAINYHQDIIYCDILMVGIRSVKKLIKGK